MSSNLCPATLLYGYFVKFCSFPAISLLVRGGRAGGRAAGRADAGYIKIKANLSLVELNRGLAELGNIMLYRLKIIEIGRLLGDC